MHLMHNAVCVYINLSRLPSRAVASRERCAFQRRRALRVALFGPFSIPQFNSQFVIISPIAHFSSSLSLSLCNTPCCAAEDISASENNIKFQSLIISRCPIERPHQFATDGAVQCLALLVDLGTTLKVSQF